MAYILSNSLFFCALGGLLLLPGILIERLFRCEHDLPDLRALAVVCLGLGTWVAVVFVLSVTGELKRTSILGVAVVAVVGAALSAFRRSAPPPQRSRLPSGELLAFGVLPSLLVLLPVSLVCMSPGVSWDADVYHLTLPRIYIENSGFRAVPFNVHSNWPMNGELLFALVMLVKDHVLAKMVHFGFGLLCLYGIHLASRETGSRGTGTLAMILFLANPVVLFEFQAAHVELAYAFFFLAAFLFMQKAVQGSSTHRAALLLSGIYSGIMAGTKITALAGVGALSVLYLAHVERGRPRSGRLRDFFLRHPVPGGLVGDGERPGRAGSHPYLRRPEVRDLPAPDAGGRPASVAPRPRPAGHSNGSPNRRLGRRCSRRCA